MEGKRMLRILAPAAVCLASAAFVGLALGQIPRAETSGSPTVLAVHQHRQTAQRKQVPRPLVLPNVNRELRRLQAADRTVQVKQMVASERVLRFWRNHRWVLAPRHAKCWEVPWQRSCTVARASQRLHAALSARARYLVDHEIPLINDWRTAVRWVQRIYPGTESWMLYISGREGGWGRPVWYSGSCSNPPCYWQGYHVGNDFLGMDTVFGPMQFRYSTFAPYWRAAEANLKSRGYIVPDIPMPPEGGDPKYAAWISPLGQALTAGYMKYYGREGCHWCL